jgi:hypothetical protein
MDFRCEDLPSQGVLLVPPGAAEYQGLLDDVRNRVDHPAAGAPPFPPPRIAAEDLALSAILLNRAAAPIALIQQVWTFEDAAGRASSAAIGNGINPSVLLPFGVPDRELRLYRYWHVILPGSKRLVTPAGEILGDNTDVRPPGPDEMWQGGVMGGRGGGGGRGHAPSVRVTLTLDGVLFADGAFAGPNRRGLWEQTVSTAEAYVDSANVARRLHDEGAPSDRILAAVESALGGHEFGSPPRAGSPPEGYRSWARGIIGNRVMGMRNNLGDDRAVYTILSWLDARVPNFRKL